MYNNYYNYFYVKLRFGVDSFCFVFRLFFFFFVKTQKQTDMVITCQFISIWYAIRLSVWLAGFIMYERLGIMLNGRERFLIYRFPIRNGWKRTLKHVYWLVIQNVCTHKVHNVKALAIIVGRHSSFVVTNPIARMCLYNHLPYGLYAHMNFPRKRVHLHQNFFFSFSISFFCIDRSIHKRHWTKQRKRLKKIMRSLVFLKI